MKTQVFIYSKNRRYDFKAIYNLSEDFCSKEQRKEFLLEARGVMDIETYPDDDAINSPRWLYSKKGDVILFGIGAMNTMLSDNYTSDITGRAIRGFFGIAIKAKEEERVSLPYDIIFFRQLFKENIVPLWEAPKEDFKSRSKEIELNLEGFKTIEASQNAILLNTDKNKCAVLGDVNAEDAVATALASREDLSLVIGLGSKGHAYAADSSYKYMNAIVDGCKQREEKVVRKNEQNLSKDNGNAGTDFPSEQKDTSKKAMRPKLIALTLVLTVVAIIAILALCSKGQNNRMNSTSGAKKAVDTMQIQKKTQKNSLVPRKEGRTKN